MISRIGSNSPTSPLSRHDSERFESSSDTSRQSLLQFERASELASTDQSNDVMNRGVLIQPGGDNHEHNIVQLPRPVSVSASNTHGITHEEMPSSTSHKTSRWELMDLSKRDFFYAVDEPSSNTSRSPSPEPYL